jgi:hypothetical protein
MREVVRGQYWVEEGAEEQDKRAKGLFPTDDQKAMSLSPNYFPLGPKFSKTPKLFKNCK